MRRNCLLKHVIVGKTEGKIEVKRGRGKRRRHTVDDLKKMLGYWKMKDEELGSALWRSRFRGGRGHVLKHSKGKGSPYTGY